jgi:predicted nucleic acid-binding protein
MDTSVLLYLFDDVTSAKYTIAQGIIQKNVIFLSAQVINETGKNLRDPKKPFKYTEAKLRDVICYLYSPDFTFVPLTKSLYLKASELRERYGFSYYDGIIVSAALSGDTKILYSEDLHDSLIVDKKLKIVNPFTHPEEILNKQS